MGNYSFIKKVIHSFYLKDVYVHVGKVEINKIGFKYLLLLISVFWIPEAVKIHFQINNYIKNELPLFIEKLPTVKIKNGTASFDKPSPYIITDKESGADLIIFDTSGQYNSLDNTNANALVTSTKIIFKKNNVETREYNFSDIQDFTLTHERLFSWAEWGNYISVIAYFFIIVFVFIYSAFQALIYSVIGLVFLSILKLNFPFQTVYRLSILSITPAFVIDKFFGYFELNLIGWSWACLALSLSYLFFALNVNKPGEQ